MENSSLTEVSFDSLGLPPELMRGLTEAGFSRCTPIQAESLPHLLAGRDVAGQAQTGTGKTAAFLVAAYTALLRKPPANPAVPRPRAFIMAPTRELAVQIHSDATQIGRHTGLRLGLAFGGTGYEEQRRTLEEGVDILIGTPGRLIDYLKQRVYSLKGIEVMVLDEADRMFDLGFIKDVRYLLRRMPPPTERLNMLFSATLTLRVTELAYEHMNNPELVQIEPEQRTVANIRQRIYYTANEEKIPLLLGLFRRMDPHRTIVFVNTKRDAERVSAYLDANGLRSALLSGDVPQNKRLRLLREFQTGELPVLVATDVAARGLHIDDVSHVVNFDLPQDPKDYVHRIGRTARLGASGDAISFACERYTYSLPEIEQYIGHPIPAEPVEESLLVQPNAPPPRPRRRRDGPGGRRPPRRRGAGGGRRR